MNILPSRPNYISLRSLLLSHSSQILGRWGRRPQFVYGPFDTGMMQLQLCLWKFSQKKLCSKCLSSEVEFYWQKQQNRVLCHPLGELGLTYTVHLWLVGKRVVDLLLVLIEHFSLALTIEAL